MSEEKKEEKKDTKAQPQPSSGQTTGPPAQGAAPPAQAQVTPSTLRPTPSPTAARPVVPPPPAPRPAVVPPPAARGPPPALPASAPKKKGRRGFLTLLAVIGVVLTLAPYVPWGEFLSASIKGSGKLIKQKVVIDNNSLYAAAAGKPVNVNDLNTFPPNSHWTITYPSSGDSTLDAQNTDSFAKFDLIRLPTELGGNSKTAADFVAFSKICVHLWCSPNYGGSSNQNPPLEHRQYECPCHGSLYTVGEPVLVGGKKVKPPVGLAIAGPAQIQPPPANAIPLLTLTTDSNGILYAEVDGGVWDVNHNGVLGLGRYVPTG